MTTILKFRHLLETHFKCILKFGEGDGGGGGKFCGLDYSGSEAYVYFLIGTLIMQYSTLKGSKLTSSI